MIAARQAPSRSVPCPGTDWGGHCTWRPRSASARPRHRCCHAPSSERERPCQRGERGSEPPPPCVQLGQGEDTRHHPRRNRSLLCLTGRLGARDRQDQGVRHAATVPACRSLSWAPAVERKRLACSAGSGAFSASPALTPRRWPQATPFRLGPGRCAGQIGIELPSPHRSGDGRAAIARRRSPGQSQVATGKSDRRLARWTGVRGPALHRSAGRVVCTSRRRSSLHGQHHPGQGSMSSEARRLRLS